MSVRDGSPSDGRDQSPILMVAENFPPRATSGTARPLYFARHLPEFGYRPVVLAAPVLNGQPSDHELLDQVPGVDVSRPAPRVGVRRPPNASLLGGASVPPATLRRRAANQLGLLQETMGWATYWHIDWLPAAFARGVQIGRSRQIQLVWVTGPPARGYPLGYLLSRALRRPLVLDVRDPWTYGSLWRPATRVVAAGERAWARTILDAAALVVFTSPFTQREMEARYPQLRGKSLTITNGFSADDAAIAPRRDGFAGRCLFRYCGILHERRRPDVLLRGLALAIEREPALRSSIHLELVGDLGGNEGALSRYGVADCVSARGRVSRAESLALMRGADVNVLLQTIATGTDVIAGKAFDYLGARRPILGVVDLDGGDAWLLRQSGQPVVSYQREGDVAEAIASLHARWRRGELHPLDGDIATYERRHLTERLAGALDGVLQAAAGDTGAQRRACGDRRAG